MLATTSWTHWLQNLQTRLARKRTSRSKRGQVLRQAPADCRVEAMEARALLTASFFDGPVPGSAVEGAGTPMVFTVSIDAPSIDTARFLIALTGTATAPNIPSG